LPSNTTTRVSSAWLASINSFLVIKMGTPGCSPGTQLLRFKRGGGAANIE
jgi:hypothetical protein